MNLLALLIETVSGVATVAALMVAARQLWLQQEELKFSNRLNALIQASSLLTLEVDRCERIVDDLKRKKGDYSKLTGKLNSILIPARHQIDGEILKLVGQHLPQDRVVREALVALENRR